MKLRTVVLSTSAALLLQPILFASCTGDACAVVYMDGDANGCTLVHNNSDRRVHAQLGQFGRDMNPREVWKVVNSFDKDKSCLKFNVGDFSAKFIQ
jgi:hypothetical protein